MKRKLVIITEIIAPYRIPVFNSLAQHQDVDLHVIFLAETDPTQREWNICKEEIHFSYQVLPSWRHRYVKQSILVNLGLTAALEEARPDVILCGGYNYVASWQAQAWARKHDIPFLVWAESTAVDQRSHYKFIESLKKKFIHGCNGFVVPGRSSSEYICSFGIPDQNIFLAPNAVDNDLFATKSASVRSDASLYREKLQLPDRFFLYVGRLVKEKGIFDLLEAYSLLPEKTQNEIGIVFVGSGPAKSKLQERVLELGLTNTRLVGFAQKEELPYYYGLAEAFILPTHSDPWGLVVNEAMACGLPVVVTNVAGCSADLVEDRRNGFLVPAHDPIHLASILEAMASSSEMCVSMGRHSREIIARYSPRMCANGIAHAALSCEVLCYA